MRSEPEQTSSAPGRILTLASGIAALRHDPRSFRYALPLARTLVRGRSALDDGVPWMTFRAIAWLRSYLRPELHVFEYGSGGSTIFLASRVTELVSVEHDLDWYATTERKLADLGLHCTYLLREPRSEADERFGSTDPAYRGMSFEPYVKAIDAYDDGTFDLVIVDGRARPACAIRAIPKVRPGGYLLLDDSDRPYYGAAIEALRHYARTDLPGAVPYSTTIGTTSIWRVDGP
jgi:hypothetical protein